MNEPNVRFRRAAGIPSRTVADRVIVARPGRDDFDAFTGPAVAVWNLLQEPRTVPELVEILSWAYDAPSADVERDVRELLRDLLDRGAVEGSDDRDA